MLQAMRSPAAVPRRGVPSGALPRLTLVLASALAALSTLSNHAADPDPIPPAPVISNRPPAPDEIGYRPAEGSRSLVNPPSFIWLHEPAADTYAIEIADNPDFQRPVAVAGFRWNTYTHSEPLPPGRLYWRYRYTTARGVASGWSQTRSVIVPAEAIPFPMPTPAQQRARVPAGHPRLFLRPEDLPRLRAAARLDAEPSTPRIDTPRAELLFRQLRESAEGLLRAEPTPEPTQRGSARNKEDAEAVRFWWPNRVQTLKACEEAETLAFVYLLTREPRFGEAARRWIRHLAAWDPDGPTNFDLNCEAAKPLLHRLSRAYDWAHDALGDEDRAAVRAAVRRRLEDAWKSGEVRQGTGHLHRPYGSHANRTWHKIGESGIVFLGEIPEAERWLDYAVNKFYAAYPVWSDDDGGWHEGVNYWAGYVSKVVWWLQAAHAALDIDGLRKPFFAQVGDFPLYVAPPHSPNMGFGDLSHGRPNAGWGGFLEYFIRAKGAQPDGSRAAYWRWWTTQWNMRPQDGILGFLYAANLPALPEPAAPDRLPTSKAFQGIGVASLHTTLLDSRDDVHLLFKASPFGTQSHGHNPHNSFQLNAYGEALLTTCVYRDLHGSRFHYQWAHSTVAHNAVLVNGQGQTPHTPAPHGRLLAFASRPEADYVAGDATPAYGNRVRRAQRHVALVKGPVPWVVVFDDLEAVQPSTFQFMLHALSPFEIDPQAARLTVQRPKAGLRATYLAGQSLQFRQWDGYQPPPNREFPNQWHVEASTVAPATRAEVLTVLLPHRDADSVPWTARRRESPTALGVELHYDGVTRTLAFRRAGAPEPASLSGRDFTGPWAVW